MRRAMRTSTAGSSIVGARPCARRLAATHAEISPTSFDRCLLTPERDVVALEGMASAARDTGGSLTNRPPEREARKNRQMISAVWRDPPTCPTL
jgi:hypothetical protein